MIDILYCFHYPAEDKDALIRFANSLFSIEFQEMCPTLRINVINTHPNNTIEDFLYKTVSRWDLRYLHIPYLNPYKFMQFHRAFALNNGIRRLCDNNIIQISDIDIVYPYWHFYRMEKLMEKHDLLTFTGYRILDADYYYKHSDLLRSSRNEFVKCHGVPLLKRDVFNYVNGFDEEYIDRGLEDCDFIERVKATKKFGVLEDVDHEICHLWHKPWNTDTDPNNSNRIRYNEKIPLYKNGTLDPTKVNSLTNISSDGLLPCPFCGGEAKEENQRGQWEGYNIKNIYCQKCAATASSKEDWNRRIKL